MQKRNVPSHYGVVIQAEGDHNSHSFFFEHDLDINDDPDSLVMTLRIREHDANDLFWWLLSVVPKLRDDRR